MADYKKYFARAIRKSFPNEHDRIEAAIDYNFKIISPDVKFARTSGNPIDKRLDFCSYVLALIKTLDEHGETYEIIRKICIEIVTDYVSPKNGIQRFLKRVPAKLVNTRLAPIFLKAFKRRVSKNPNPDGFIANIITDKQETYGLGYGVDILECGICKLFSKHNYKKYSSILCEIDEITSGLAGLKLIRTGTIALGAKKCDFRYKKITSG